MLYQEGLDFKRATQTLYQKQISLYRTTTIVLGCLLSLCLLAVIFLSSISHVEAFLVSVDKRTGEVAIPKRLQVKNFTPTKNMVRHFSSQYITKWTSYNALNIKKPFYEVLSMSSKNMANKYKRMFLRDNPQSPINLLGRNRYQTVKIHSISELSIKNTLDLRYTTFIRESSNDQPVKQQEWRAVMKWQINTNKHSLSDWDANPIGFVVTYLDIQAVK